MSGWLDISNARKCNQHGQKAQTVKKEISRHADESHGKSAERGAQNPRHIKLRRIERDSVGEIFSRHKLRHQRLIRWRIERHGDAGAKREKNNLIYIDDF